MVVSQGFGEPVTSAPLAGHATVLEALQAGIAGQMSVLDDASLTGTGRSSADVLGVPSSVLAQTLTGHLLREIVIRGARSGPLFPLASQLNDDVTHLQGQRIEVRFGQLADEVRQAFARLDSNPAVTTREEPARTSNTISGGTFFGPVFQGRDIRVTVPVSAGGDVSEQKVAGHVFISYIREDSDRVDQLQRILQAAGIPVWRDTADLWPGEDWRARIRGAITSNALVFLACFSRSSLARSRSYQNEELLLAIEQLRQRPPERPWLIPVRFDDCEIPDRDIGGGRTLTSIQRVDLFDDRYDEGARRLVAAILRILGRDSDSAATETDSAPQEPVQPRTEPAFDSQGSGRVAEPDHVAGAEIPAAAPRSGRAFTGRWRHTVDGFAASPLMNMVHTAMPGYLGSQQQMPFVRVGACVASDPVPPDARSGHVGDRFVALLSRDPIAGFISRLTYVGDKVTWMRHAGNGVLRLDAVMSGGDEHERPTAFRHAAIPGDRDAQLWARRRPRLPVAKCRATRAGWLPAGFRPRAVVRALVPGRGYGCGAGGLPGWGPGTANSR